MKHRSLISNALTSLGSNHRTRAIAAIAVACMLVSSHVGRAGSQNTVQCVSGGLRLQITAVDPGVFHVTAFPDNQPQPPTSPFVVETQPWSGTVVRQSAAGETLLQTPAATMQIARDGSFTLVAPGSAGLVRAGRIAMGEREITITLPHASDQRLYGAGNAGENTAGHLMHSSGEQTVGNGVTRIPFIWSTGGYGVLVANNEAGVSWSDSQDTLTWHVPGPYADFYLMVGNGSYGLLDAYSRLTGRAPIPPRWTFGYMISRWGYGDAADVQDKWHQFRDRKIPVDAFIYDYDWFVDDWKVNPKTFPDDSIAQMKAMGLHFVGIRKPRVNGRNKDFAAMRGWTMPSGLGTDLRFDVPEVRYWWWSNQVLLVQAGVDGWWNDEAEQTYDEFFQMTRAEWEGWRAMSSRRAWSINRAFAPGMQRFGAAVWTGDINSDWQTLQNQPGTMLNWNMAGMPYTGQDIGGFQTQPTPELYARWIEEGVFVPVMRSHGSYNLDRWPWAFGPDAQDAIVQAIDLRYRLIPYLYTCSAETARTGKPIMRPLFLEFPSDKNTYDLEDEWLVGDRILAAPILTQGGNRSVYLPEGDWYDFNTSKPVSGGRTVDIQNASLATIPVYLRTGSILPLGPVLQSTSLGKEDPLEVRIYPGANGFFELYEDGGDDYSYLTGKSSTIPFRWDDARRTLVVGARLGTFPGMLLERHLTITLPTGESRSVVYDGRLMSVRL